MIWVEEHRLNLENVNSATKYPSILTYHELGEHEMLNDNVQIDFNDADKIILTEKIDGTNGRIIIFPDGSYLIGSREELLYASGDLLFNASTRIVETIRGRYGHSIENCKSDKYVMVIFGEVYGHKVGSACKNYTKNDKNEYRIFDVMYFGIEEFHNLIHSNTVAQIAHLRDNGNLGMYCNEKMITFYADTLNCQMTPRLNVSFPPTSISDTLNWLKTVLPSNTNAAIDGEGGKPEGVVIRTDDRSKIAKIKFRDYERALKFTGPGWNKIMNRG